MKKLVLILLLFAHLTTFSQNYSTKQFKGDFDFFWSTINDNYCYFNKKQIDWNKIRELYATQIDTVRSRRSFVKILERVVYELYDHHCSLGTNYSFSRRLVPTSTDIWAEFRFGKPFVTEVRKGFGADKVGVKEGMEIVAVNDVITSQAIIPFLGHTNDAEAKNYALRLLLAGDHYTKRKITLKYKNSVSDYYPDKDGMMLENVTYSSNVESKVIGKIGYIRINNCLYDNNIIPQFDSVLTSMLSLKGLILDMRETPSGGNTTVARAILGRFIDKEHYYQKHELYSEEKKTGIKRSWMEIVSPRGITYLNPVVIIANHWTGSVGEAITTAFDGIKRATVIGTPMAGLNGAIETFEMPNTKIRFNLPVERLYQINGTPRESYQPQITVVASGQATSIDDAILDKAIYQLNKKTR